MTNEIKRKLPTASFLLACIKSDRIKKAASFSETAFFNNVNF